MMEYPVVYEGCPVGSCTVVEDGLYWIVDCTCELCSGQVERLYSGSRRIDVLEQKGNRLVCRKRVSKASAPELLPASGVFSLSPERTYAPWEGSLLGQPAKGFRDRDLLLFPYSQDQPCPCEPLICFFEIRDGFWRLPAKDEWLT